MNLLTKVFPLNLIKCVVSYICILNALHTLFKQFFPLVYEMATIDRFLYQFTNNNLFTFEFWLVNIAQQKIVLTQKVNTGGKNQFSVFQTN